MGDLFFGKGRGTELVYGDAVRGGGGGANMEKIRSIVRAALKSPK